MHRYTCFVLVVGESHQGDTAAARIQMSGTDIERQFPLSLREGSLLQHALHLVEAKLPEVAPDRPVRARQLARLPPPAPFSPMNAVFLDEVRARIEHLLAEPDFSVESLAHELALSPRQFRRKIVDLTGVTPQMLLRRARVERAEMLLRCGTPSIKEVAHAVGYATEEGLRRAFVAVRGTPPSFVTQT